MHDIPVSIKTQEQVEMGLDILIKMDPSLGHVAAKAGKIPLRSTSADFCGLARIITGQQLSVPSASAIWGRYEKLPFHNDPEKLLAEDSSQLASCGLSRAKIRCLLAVAQTLRDGLDLADLAVGDPDEAQKRLIEIPGIGPWTANIFSLFCAGHRDIFPASDLALRKAVRHGLNLQETPSAARLETIAARWSPLRSVAARLFWAYYGALKPSVAILPV